MSKEEYICEDCGGTFDTGWTDEEASVEFQQNFQAHNIKTAVLVCDDCYKKYVTPPTPQENKDD